MKKNIYLILILLFVFSISGCDWFSSKDSSYKGKALAKINNWILGDKDFNDQVKAIVTANNNDPVVPILALGLPFVFSDKEKIDLSTTEGKKFYLNTIINREIIAQEAKIRKLDKNPNIAKNIKRATTEILYIAQLNETLKKVTVTPLEIEELYKNEYKNTLENINQRKIREIVLDTEAKATSVLVELLQGADFSSLALKRSVSESAKDGGDLGYLVYQPNIKFQKFWEIVLLLDKDQVSSIFQDPTTKQFYIVKIDDIKKGEPEPLSNMYDLLEFTLKKKKSIKAINELISNTKHKFEVEINSKLLE